MLSDALQKLQTAEHHVQSQLAMVERLRAQQGKATKSLEQASSHVAALTLEVEREKEARETAISALTSQYDTSLEEMSAYYQQLLDASNSTAQGIESESVAFLEKSEGQRKHIAGWIGRLDHNSRKELASYMSEFCSTFLFGRLPPEEMSRAILQLLERGNSLLAVLRGAARLYPNLHSSERFRAVRGYLRQTIEMPVLDDPQGEDRGFVIVDVGAEALEFQNDVYAPVLKSHKCHLVRFDPFSKVPAGKARMRKIRFPGSRSRQLTLPCFIGTGETATFHVNRYGPTSSLYRGNAKVAAPFGLLKDSLETVETIPVKTQRLDDVCKGRSWAKSTVDLLKIDVQGGTFDVISNATDTLSKTLVCQLEAEFAEVYSGEVQFSAIDEMMRQSDFGLLDLHDPGHQTYGAMSGCGEGSYHPGRLLWSDFIYIKHLDDLDRLDSQELLKVATLLHEMYRKYDVTAECLRLHDEREKSNFLATYQAAFA